MFADNIEITGYVSGLTWQNTISELATTMSFEVAKSDANYLSLYTPNLGSIISLVTNEEIFRGIVLTVDDGDLKVNKYTICDFGWYLNKSKETYQLNQMPAKKVIEKVCSDFNISIDSIPSLKNKVTKIYFDKTISDIFKDVLELCGGGYNFDLTPNGLRIYKIGDIYAYPEFILSPNTKKIFSPNARGNVSHSRSIEDIKNSIKVITEKDDMYSVKTVAKNQKLINKYGLLQEIIKIDPEKENPITVANEKLQELSNIKEILSIDIIEALDSYTRAGSIITIQSADYIIESSSHNIKNGIHYVKLDLKRRD